MEKNCLDCLYANYTETYFLLKEMGRNFGDNEFRKCEHLNSPYFDEIVDESTTCRLFVDEKEYFINKDRRDKIDELRNKMRKRK